MKSASKTISDKRKEYLRKYRQKHKEKLRAYAKEYFKKWYSENRERILGDHGEKYKYRYVSYADLSKKKREGMLAYKKRIQKDPLHIPKIEARNAVKVAIRSGKLIKKPCEVCGETKVHGHHDDYSKPLEVRWLCPKHHGLEHRK